MFEQDFIINYDSIDRFYLFLQKKQNVRLSI